MGHMNIANDEYKLQQTQMIDISTEHEEVFATLFQKYLKSYHHDVRGQVWLEGQANTKLASFLCLLNETLAWRLHMAC